MLGHNNRHNNRAPGPNEQLSSMEAISLQSQEGSWNKPLPHPSLGTLLALLFYGRTQ